MNGPLNSDDEKHWALVAQSIPECTPAVLLSLLESLHSYRQLFDGCDQTEDVGLNQQLKLIRQQYHSGQWQPLVDQINRVLINTQAQIVPITSADYPQQLQQIAKPPTILYLCGDINCLYLPQIAIVGSRRMTRGGEIVAKSWAKYLAERGFTITSGLALGIDACAHQGALNAEQGKTIGVMATGIDRFYPSRNTHLREQIIHSGGALITEFPPGTEPRPSYFPQRNRIISGLSLGVLVVEAATKSGSLTTAKYALEQDREVFAIPSSINNPQSKGCHQLIKQGACLVETAAELVAELSGPLARYGELHAEFVDNSVPESESSPKFSAADQLTDEEAELLEMLGFDPIQIDDLKSPWPMDKLLQLLIALELKELVSSEQGYYQRL